MHKAGKKLTVAVATWNPIWNLNLIGKTSVDKIMYVKRLETCASVSSILNSGRKQNQKKSSFLDFLFGLPSSPHLFS